MQLSWVQRERGVAFLALARSSCPAFVLPLVSTLLWARARKVSGKSLFMLPLISLVLCDGQRGILLLSRKQCQARPLSSPSLCLLGDEYPLVGRALSLLCPLLLISLCLLFIFQQNFDPA